MNRAEDRRKAVRVAVEAMKNFDALKTLNELSEHAIYMAKVGIKRQKPNISERELLEELRRIVAL